MRLLAKTIRIDDLTNLFLCTGGTCTSDALCEVSDFVVRSDVRIKTLVTETAKDWTIPGLAKVKRTTRRPIT